MKSYRAMIIGFGVGVTVLVWVVVVVLLHQTKDPEDTDRPNALDGGKNRPFVFFKYVALEEPLSVGKEAVVSLILANSGGAEAEVNIRDSTSYFEAPDRRGPRPTYATTPPNIFKMAPTAEVNGRIKIAASTLYLTAANIKDIVEGRANLYFFARGEYKDDTGRTWPLPFCRMYADDFPGKLINCPDGMKIDERGSSPPSVGIDGYKFLVFEANKKIQIQAALANRGDAVALRLRVASALSHGLPPIPKPFRIPVKDGDPISVTDLGMGGRWLTTLTSAEIVSSKQFREIIDGKRALYVMGRGTYYDESGKCYPVKYCAFYDPVSKSLAACPEEVEYEHPVTDLRCPN